MSLYSSIKRFRKARQRKSALCIKRLASKAKIPHCKLQCQHCTLQSPPQNLLLSKELDLRKFAVVNLLGGVIYMPTILREI